MNILVTGVAGFIGSNLADTLIDDGHVVYGIDNFDSYYDRHVKEGNIAELMEATGFRFYEADLRDRHALATVFGTAAEAGRSIDAVIHLAAKAGVRPSIEDPHGYVEVNVDGTVNLLETMVASDVRDLLFASSSSVYGNTDQVPFREDAWVDHPISPYAATKKAGELLCHTYAHLHGMRIAALRFFTVYGPRQRPDLAIAKFTKLIDTGRPIPVYGDGSTRRDYTYVADTVDGIVGALAWVREQQSGTYDVFNLGESRTVSLSELISALEDTLGRTAQIDRRPLQPGDVEQTWADITRAREAFGYDPQTTLAEGLDSYVNWYRAHADTEE
ncbi:MAG: SDR family NAD(P)-dependent oxidoreductase [Alkalispirochaeta sp.]